MKFLRDLVPLASCRLRYNMSGPDSLYCLNKWHRLRLFIRNDLGYDGVTIDGEDYLLTAREMWRMPIVHSSDPDNLDHVWYRTK